MKDSVVDEISVSCEFVCASWARTLIATSSPKSDNVNSSLSVVTSCSKNSASLVHANYVTILLFIIDNYDCTHPDHTIPYCQLHSRVPFNKTRKFIISHIRPFLDERCWRPVVDDEAWEVEGNIIAGAENKMRGPSTLKTEWMSFEKGEVRTKMV